MPPTSAPSHASPPWSAPTPIPTHGWSTEEIAEASRTLDAANWPTFTDIYDHVKEGGFEFFDAQALLKKARVLQLTLQMAARDGRFSRLATLLQDGQKGMENVIWTDAHLDGRFCHYYEKTAGDLVQSCWCRWHLEHMGLCFQTNPVQAGIAKWLRLPLLVLPRCISEKVESWSEHPLADFQEMLTLYLPSKLVDLYLNVCTSFFLNFVQDRGVDERCRLRNDVGLLCCDKKVNIHYPRFCCCSHYDDKRQRARAAFNGADYGHDYADLHKHDMVDLMEHAENGGGWSYAKNLRTTDVGWVPTEFVVSQ